MSVGLTAHGACPQGPQHRGDRSGALCPAADGEAGQGGGGEGGCGQGGGEAEDVEPGQHHRNFPPFCAHALLLVTFRFTGSFHSRALLLVTFKFIGPSLSRLAVSYI